MNDIFNIESEELFISTLEEVVRNLYKTSRSNIENKAKEELKQLYSSSNYQIDDVINNLKGRELNVERLKTFISLLNENRNEILYFALVEHNTTYGKCITNFDWKLKYILGSSCLKSARYPVLQIHLNTADAAGETKSTVYEMKKDELSKLISAIEDAVK